MHRETKKIVWLALLQYSLYCRGLQPAVSLSYARILPFLTQMTESLELYPYEVQCVLLQKTKDLAFD